MTRRSKRLIKNTKNKIKLVERDTSLRYIFDTQGVDPQSFKIIQSEYDNACLYKSLANGLILNSNTEENAVELSKKIQEQCYKWIIQNSDFILLSGETIMELVSREHFEDNDEDNFETNFNKYKTWYQYYAAMEFSEISKINQELKKEDEVVRWGGVPELIAFSEIYKYTLNVYMPKIYNEVTNKINNGKIITRNNELIPCKNVKYMLSYQKYTPESNGNEINVLFRKTKLHYDLLKEC